MAKVCARTLYALLLLHGISTVKITYAAGHSQEEKYEPAVLSIVETIQEGDLTEALTLTQQHLSEFPKSRVGHLLKADILQAMVNNPVVLAGETTISSGSISEKAETSSGISQQIKNRWLHHNRDQSIVHEKVPASLINMGRHKHVIVSDMQEGRLYLYRNNNGSPELVRDYYLSVGSAGYGKEVEGDNRTPIGVYSIYKHISDAELPDLYGKGAYPVNYPNLYDRAKKRTGYGIWLHGTPSNTYARAPWASEGCFVLSNDDLLDIERYIDVDSQTPVVLADSIDWVTENELDVRRTQLTRTIEAWKQDWESLNTSAYLEHYSQNQFNFGTEPFKPWADRKQHVNAGKTFVQVDMEVDSLFLYPGVKDMFVVQYTQRYISNNYSGASQKQQFWQRDEQGLWKIIFES